MIALDFTCLPTFHAKVRARISSAVGLLFVTIFNSFSSSSIISLSWTRSPPLTFFISNPPGWYLARMGVCKSLRFLLPFNATSASGVYPGAITASMTWADEQLGVVRSPQVTGWIIVFFLVLASAVLAFL